MKTQPDGRTIRQTLLSVVDEYSRKPPHEFKVDAILEEAANQLGIPTEGRTEGRSKMPADQR